MQQAPDSSRSPSRALAALLGLVVAACAPYEIVEFESANQSSRIDYLVIHFTSEDFAESMRLLTEPTDRPVSSHYLIPESGDETYPASRLRIHRLVPEHRRAWHAGQSAWGDEETLNDRSIGIELVNVSGCEPDDPDATSLRPIEDACDFRPFDDAQIDLLILLVRDILERYPDLDPVDVVGHADIAPDRKIDPGPGFPWKRLYDAGIGAWYDEETVERYQQRFEQDPPDVGTVRRALGLYGYRIDACGGTDLELQQVLRAFQMHFLPQAVTLQADRETSATLFALLEKYRAEDLPELWSATICDKPAEWVPAE